MLHCLQLLPTALRPASGQGDTPIDLQQAKAALRDGLCLLPGTVPASPRPLPRAEKMAGCAALRYGADKRVQPGDFPKQFGLNFKPLPLSLSRAKLGSQGRELRPARVNWGGYLGMPRSMGTGVTVTGGHEKPNPLPAFPSPWARGFATQHVWISMLQELHNQSPFPPVRSQAFP